MALEQSRELPEGLSEKQLELWEQPFTGYRIINILGEGASGTVLLAEDLRLGREVAIKTLVPDPARAEAAPEQFFNEARQTARLRHENIVRGVDTGRAGKYFFYAMEYIRGESLQQRLDGLQSGRIRELESLQHVRQIANGLQFIFEQGLAHRDVKPRNILIGNDGIVRLADFGVAKDLAFPSAATQALACAEYVSPEFAADEANIDIRADLYALGCCWYRMLLGRSPFAGDSAPVILRKHISDDPTAPHEADPRITPATSQLILWLLTKDREKRPRNPQLFLAKLMTHPLFKLAQERNLIESPDIEAEPAEEEEDLAGIYYTGPGAKKLLSGEAE